MPEEGCSAVGGVVVEQATSITLREQTVEKRTVRLIIDGGNGCTKEAMVISTAMDRKHLATFLLIGTLVFVFGWFGLDKLRSPILWSGFLPLWMDGLFQVGNDSWIVVIGILELLFALLLLVPIRRIRQTAAILIAAHFTGIIWQVGWNDVGVRDIGLLMSDVALMILL